MPRNIAAVIVYALNAESVIARPLPANRWAIAKPDTSGIRYTGSQ
jgi:hypothetical protein